MSQSRCRVRRFNRNGFSLIEMLVVIAIMSILMTIGAIGLGGLTGGKSVASGVASSEALFEEARLIAQGKGTTARVMVSVDNPSDSTNYLRRLVVIYKELDANGVPTENWVLSSRGTVLPDGVYFSRSYSVKDLAAGSGTQLEEFTLQTGGNVKQAFAGKYVYYEFNSEGICTTPGASFIIGSGARGLSDQNPRVTGSAKRDFAGFVVWRKGSTSSLRSPDQMNIPTNVTTF